MREHCCAMMRSNVERTCDVHLDLSDCPDLLIAFWPDPAAYGIRIHDGGSSVVAIAHCPWCGVALPISPIDAQS